MTSVISGSGLGLLNTSLATLSGQGAVGNANIGQSGSQVYVNGAPATWSSNAKTKS